jgi:WD40 repeat protein
LEQCLPDGHNAPVDVVAFSPDGQHITSHSDDKSLCVWDAQTGALVDGPLKTPISLVTRISFSPNGPRVATVFNDMVRVWDLHVQPTVADLLKSHIDMVFSIGFRVLSDTEPTVLAGIEHTVAPAFRHNGAVDVDSITDGDQSISRAAVDMPTDALVLRGHTDTVTCISFSPDGKWIVSGSEDTTIHIWDAYSGALVGLLIDKYTSYGICCVVFSPSGEQIASGSEDGTLSVWDVQTGTLVAGPFQGHNDVVRSISFSPDGERIVSGSQDTTVRVWDVQMGTLITPPLEGHTRAAICVAFSPDGKWIASGSRDRTVCLWDAHNLAAAPRLFEGHGGPVLSVIFSPGSQRVASGSSDRTIRVSEVCTTYIGIHCCADLYGQIQANSISNHPFKGNWMLKDGWILDPAFHLILWVPAWLREGLYFPQTSLIISASPTTKLDFSDFAHGELWQECIKSLHLVHS